MRLRAATLGNPVVNHLIGIQFPVSGSLSGSTSLGIWWANASDHTQQLDAAKFPFTTGWSYSSVNAFSATNFSKAIDAGLGVPFANSSYTLEFFLVNAAGADMYSLGSAGTNVGNIDPTMIQFAMIAFFAIAGSTPGNGIRGAVTFSGQTMALVIPATWLFFGQQ